MLNKPSYYVDLNQQINNIQNVLDLLDDKSIKITFEISLADNIKKTAVISREQDSMLIESLICFLEADAGWRKEDIQNYILSRLHKP